MDDRQLMEEVRSSLWHIAASLKGIELHLQNAEHLGGISNSLEAFMGGWQAESQPMGSFQEFLRAYQATQEAHTAAWVPTKDAAKAVHITPRALMKMYDEGRLDPSCAKQTNKSSSRRRLLFNVKLLQQSIGISS